MYEINILAILVAAASNMVLGSLWYSHALFGKPWKKLNKLTDKQLKKMDSKEPYIMTIVASLVTAYVLNYLMIVLGISTGYYGALLGALMWAGFSASTSLADYMFSMRPKNLYSINAMYSFFGFIIMGAIIGMWM